MNYPFAIPQAEPATVIHLAAADPAAGTAYVYTCPADVIRQVVYCNYGFTSDGNAANRFAKVMTERGGIPYQVHMCATAHVATTIKAYYFMTGSKSAAITDLCAHIYLRMSPNVILNPGDEFRIEVSNIQAGDQISPIRITFFEWEIG